MKQYLKIFGLAVATYTVGITLGMLIQQIPYWAFNISNILVGAITMGFAIWIAGGTER